MQGGFGGDCSVDSERINQKLAVHQASVEDWDYRDLAADLQTWVGRFVCEFKLEIGTPALAFERLRANRLGHFRPGRNGFGLRDEIAVSIDQLGWRNRWQALGTLLHELLHSWQQEHGIPGKRNYHNQEFRKKAEELGLQVDARGVTTYVQGDTPFFLLLRRHGVEIPDVPERALGRRHRGSSKLKLWQCACGVKVRVGRAELRARCLDCNCDFERQER